MTVEVKAKERCDLLSKNNCEYQTFWKDGYAEGQKDTEEKMKCCGNCQYADHIWNKCRYDGNCKNYNKWGLAEN